MVVSHVRTLANSSSPLQLMEGREYVFHKVSAGLWYAAETAFQKDNNYTLFRSEDALAWLVFTCTFIVLIIFDNVILHRSNKALSVTTAFFYTLFWIACAFGFSGFVFWRYGASSSFNWVSGYLLEWMLSFDNLFVFHLIFNV